MKGENNANSNKIQWRSFEQRGGTLGLKQILTGEASTSNDIDVNPAKYDSDSGEYIFSKTYGAEMDCEKLSTILVLFISESLRNSSYTDTDTFSIEASTDKKTWDVLITKKDSEANQEIRVAPSKKYRYVRLALIETNGYSYTLQFSDSSTSNRFQVVYLQ